MLRVQTHDLVPMACPICRERLEQSTGTGRPQPGGITMCAHCYAYLAFTEALGLRRLTDREWLRLPTAVRQLLTQMRDLLRRRGVQTQSNGTSSADDASDTHDPADDR